MSAQDNLKLDIPGGTEEVLSYWHNYMGGLIAQLRQDMLVDLRREIHEIFRVQLKEFRLDGVAESIDGVNKRLDGVDRRLDGVDERLLDVQSRIETLEIQERRHSIDLREMDKVLRAINTAPSIPQRRKTYHAQHLEPHSVSGTNYSRLGRF